MLISRGLALAAFPMGKWWKPARHCPGPPRLPFWSPQARGQDEAVPSASRQKPIRLASGAAWGSGRVAGEAADQVPARGLGKGSRRPVAEGHDSRRGLEPAFHPAADRGLVRAPPASTWAPEAERRHWPAAWTLQVSADAVRDRLDRAFCWACHAWALPQSVWVMSSIRGGGGRYAPCRRTSGGSGLVRLASTLVGVSRSWRGASFRRIQSGVSSASRPLKMGRIGSSRVQMDLPSTRLAPFRSR